MGKLTEVTEDAIEAFMMALPYLIVVGLIIGALLS